MICSIYIHVCVYVYILATPTHGSKTASDVQDQKCTWWAPDVPRHGRLCKALSGEKNTSLTPLRTLERFLQTGLVENGLRGLKEFPPGAIFKISDSEVSQASWRGWEFPALSY